jgi:signal transduction histidine kinase
VNVAGEAKRGDISPRMILGFVAVLSAAPFLLVRLFPTQFHHVMSPASYVAFHNVVEYFSILVSFSIFGVGWFTYSQTRDRHALFMSGAFLAIGLLDFLHSMSNAAMPAFITPNSPNKSIQFWIAARFVTAGAFLGSAYIHPESEGRWLSKSTLMVAGFGLPVFVLVWVVFFPSYTPVMFVRGLGVTPFKMVSEYVIICLFVVASIAYWRRMARTGDRLLLYYISSFIISIFSEMTFSMYVSVFDTYNVLGHVYKVVAFSLIYYGFFITTVKKPYARLLKTGGELQEEIVERKAVEEEIRQHRSHLEDLVKQRTAELESTNEQLRRENRDRRRAEEALSERTADLENTNRDLESFSYSVSHDLRAPLRAIGGYSRMIFKTHGDLFDEDAKRQFQVIKDSVGKMEHLIADLLAFSRLGRKKISRISLDMKKLIQEVWEEVAAINSGRTVTLKIGPMPAAQGDRTLIRQVYSNLLGNAVKFTNTRENAVIELGSITKNGECVYYIRDNGVGFDMKFYNKLFGVFSRLHSESEYEGTGIGLALVQRIIHHHGGRVWADAKVDEGACFYFTLPPQERGYSAP